MIETSIFRKQDIKSNLKIAIIGNSLLLKIQGYTSTFLQKKIVDYQRNVYTNTNKQIKNLFVFRKHNNKVYTKKIKNYYYFLPIIRHINLTQKVI